MKSALIGYTGFVGSNLNTQNKFDDLYNSKNINEVDGKKYDLVVCAGARAEKWRINQEPEKDLVEIQDLTTHISTINTKKFVLVSTIDVYKTPYMVDENSSIETKGLHPYGLHRYELEEFCLGKFDTLVIRLPGLFGPGLKKNVIFDLLHNNNIDRIHHAGSFQYYSLNNIWRDIQVALAHNLRIVNFATEPIRTDEITKNCFGIKNFNNEPDATPPGRYDMWTIHSKIFGEQGHYIYKKQQVLKEINEYIETYQESHAQ